MEFDQPTANMLILGGEAAGISSLTLALLLGILMFLICYCVFWRAKDESLQSEQQRDDDNAACVSPMIVRMTVADATEQIGIGRAQFMLLAITGLTFTADAGEIVFLSFVPRVLRCEWGMTSTEESLIISGVFAGMLIGAPIWGWASDHFGRRPAFLWSSFIIMSCGILTAISPNIVCLVTARVMVGVGVAGLPVGFDILAEALPASRRGGFLLYIELFWGIGSIYMTICAKMALEPLGWRMFTALAALPTMISTVTAYWFLPESPLWLADNERYEEALVVVNSWAAANESGLKVTELRAEPEDDGENESSAYRVLGILALVWFCFGMAYYGIVLLLPRILIESNPETRELTSFYRLPSDVDICKLGFDFMGLAYSSFAEMAAVVVAIMTIDRVGRTRTEFVFYVMLTVMLLLMSGSDNWSRAALTTIACLGRFAAMGGCCATWVHTPELFQTKVRGEAHAACNFASKVGGILAPIIIGSSFSDATSTYIMASAACVAAIAALHLPETAGEPLK